ncbi:ATP-dependent helicase HepA [Streptomyces sp. YIM 130001]|uniref:DEAD/DEAH box helicase n=1 Tax=Streptomyces sp. YIM 130001 TaxID=2259644 RepID=UPI000EC1E715|nr:DEAD/DEAH box helicase [Streptomyces sp. YIM 130001]RII19837.1 ATP-dependent helicase HepA [Streptomyces sp. YIM 130001]
MAQDVPVTPGRQARAVLHRAGELLGAARAVVEEYRGAQQAVRDATRSLEDALARAELTAFPVSRLRDVTRGQLRETTVEALTAAGYTSVGQVLDADTHALRRVPGIGSTTAAQLLAAAQQLHQSAAGAVAVRINVDAAGGADPASAARHTQLVLALNRLLLAGPGIPEAAAVAERTAEALEPQLATARPTASRLTSILLGRERRTAAKASLAALTELLAQADADDVPLALGQAATDLMRGPAPTDEAWLDFQVRAADYYTLLGRIADLPEDRASTEGFLPSGIAEEIRAQPLDESLLRVSLRGYQAFGARFALVRRRVLIGDEMGLGKTIQAIAAMAHLRAAEEARHFLVVCPAGVLINWIREVEARSTLPAYRAHGRDREASIAAWTAHGGVLVTTYDLLWTLELPTALDLGMLVADEAHYVKNPATRRADAVQKLIRRRTTGRVLFLTGTPMQNHVAEFRSLVGQLQPKLVHTIGYGTAAGDSKAFRAAVAPCYLRRNQPDVLTELPGVIYADAWEEFSDGDRAAYRKAVADGNFMAMRRAGYADPKRSAKLHRLRELVGEAAENGLKVVVFSTFLDVLQTAHDALTVSGPVAEAGTVTGMLTGAVPTDRRQELVDAFTRAPGHAVLLAQIRTGGIGLNLQAASVVVLCEPQLNPALEAQAVGRAHRMGQVRRVQVHRLLATDSVDQHLLGILEEKKARFDAYARRSELAESVPEALDISEPDLARRIVEDEQLRLALGGGPAPPD